MSVSTPGGGAGGTAGSGDMVGLQPKYILGLRADIENNVHYMEDKDVLYPVGAILVIHNFVQHRQKFIRLPDRGLKVNSMCIMPNRRIIAVTERGEPPSISLYDVGSLKRKRQLIIPINESSQSFCKEIISISFTFDGKYLIAVTGEPEWMLYCYRWEKGKIESSTRANNLNGTGTVHCIACNPSDAALLVVAGDALFRILAVSDNIWRQFGFSKADQISIRCLAWLTQSRLAAGTDDGRLLFLENGELRQVICAEDVSEISFALKDLSDQPAQPLLLLNQQQNSGMSLPSCCRANQNSCSENVSTESEIVQNSGEITCLQAFSKGLIYAQGMGTMHLFEKETSDLYVKRNVFRMVSQNGQLVNSNVCAINVSPIQDCVIATCRGITQIFHAHMWGPGLSRQPITEMKELGPMLHRGPVVALASCLWKPLMMTAGKDDRSVKLWNYETDAPVLGKMYQEDIYGLDLHPTGLYAIVGFSGKLRFLTVLIDDLAVTRELPVRCCAVCRFSVAGHVFVAANGNVLQLYSTITFENLINLKGHNGRITGVAWTYDDQRLMSCGADGAMYEWDVWHPGGRRITELIDKSCTLTTVQTSGSSSSSEALYVAGSDGRVQEVSSGMVRMEAVVVPAGVECAALSRSGHMYFVAAGDGTVWSVRVPLMQKPELTDQTIHNKLVVQMRMSYDDRHLLSCSSDGSICVWRLTNTLGRTIKLDKDFSVSADILIPYEDLREKMQNIQDLTRRISELETEHAYQMRQSDLRHSAKLKDVHEAYCKAIEELKEKNTQMEAEHAHDLRMLVSQLDELKSNHETGVQHLEAAYNEKLIAEYAKYVQLEDKLLRTRTDYETQMEEAEKSRRQAEDTLREEMQRRVQEKDVVIEELQEELAQQKDEHEVTKQQIEDDADREIYELRTRHETELKDEQVSNVKLRGENGTLKKKIVTSQKEIDELKHQVFTLEGEHVKFKGVITGLEKDMAELKNEIGERDETIQHKERRIYELKKKNQELDKYKYVLEFKIRELKDQIEPRERKIHDQKNQIDEMVTELDNLQKVIISLELQVKELQEKLSSSHNEFHREQQRHRRAIGSLMAMRTDLNNLSNLTQDPKQLKMTLRAMHHKYNVTPHGDSENMRADDTDVRDELTRQRDYLERALDAAKVVVEESKFNKIIGVDAEKLKLMDEGAHLIEETNTLRAELKGVQRHNKQLESVLGISGKYMMPREAQQRLAAAVQTRDDMRNIYQQQLSQDNDCIHALKDDNRRILSQYLSVTLPHDQKHVEQECRSTIAHEEQQPIFSHDE